MTEQRNQRHVLKKELKLAQRVIKKEVGEGANMNALLNSTGGWRGRAQQILTLQSIPAEFGEQLRHGRQNGSTRLEKVDIGDIEAAPMTDSRQKTTLKKIESDKQRTLMKHVLN